MSKVNLVVALKHQLRGWPGPNGRNRALTVPLNDYIARHTLQWIVERIIKAQEYGGATATPQVWALEATALTCHAESLTGPIIYSDGILLNDAEPVIIEAVFWRGVWHLGLEQALDPIFEKLKNAFNEYDRAKADDAETQGPDGPANS